jgi:acetyl-CoA C-acetyltransferase
MPHGRRVRWSAITPARSRRFRHRAGGPALRGNAPSHSLSSVLRKNNVWILGAYQSDFARNLTREGRDFADLTAEVVDATLAAAALDASDIGGVVHVANAFGEMFARQAHLGAMPASVNDALWNTPASRHEAACASGGVATLAAIADLRSSAYRSALVVGVELEKTVPGDTAAEHLGAAAWTDHEGGGAKFM